MGQGADILKTAPSEPRADSPPLMILMIRFPRFRLPAGRQGGETTLIQPHPRLRDEPPGLLMGPPTRLSFQTFRPIVCHTNLGLLLDSRIFFLMRTENGATSTSSSSLINSMACSRLRILGGISCKASSDPAALILVRFFSLVTLTFRSFSLDFSPITIPS